jgi:hypothetical protein
MRRASRLLVVLPGRARATDRAVPARCAPRTAGPLVAPAVCAPAEAAVPRPHLHGHAIVITIEPRPYLSRAPAPPRADTTACRAIRAAAGELALSVLLQCAQPSLTLP